ncbi:hypothetical protein PQQ96_13270 [Paraburkholderia sediminicola]|uniref:hypothetical protein n=1 Tax=Paraburkholderia sediminicola TaxID=458836 RepID=UPI0038B920C1
MTRHTRLKRSAPVALSSLKRRPLYQVLALWGAAVTCGSASLAGNVAVAALQVTENLPAPNQPAVIAISTGTPGPYGSGQQGGNGSDGSIGLAAPDILPSILFSSVGGAGGTGQDGGDPTGNGGAGGNAGALVLILGAGSGVNSVLAGPAAVWLSSTGGNGGTAGKMASSSGYPGQPGAGGNSQSINFSQYGSVISTNGWNGSTPGTTAILLTANGGNAAQPLGSDGADGAGQVTGANGSMGGLGGDIAYSLYQGDVISKGSAIVVSSQGGNGGDGTMANSDIGEGKGGNGGQGGEAGQMLLVIGQGGSSAPNIVATGAPTAAAGASVPIDANGDTVQAAVMAAGIQAQSLGGLGGLGGEGDGTVAKGGAGGAAGAGNSLNIALNNANISTTGFAAAGVLAQSIGGAGGNGGGAGGMFFSGGGNGSPGGASGAVTITMGNASTTWPSDLISTTGDDSMGVVAQSIGGGGGAGGSVQTGSLLAGITIGGNGETGGAAGTVTLNNGALASINNPVEAGFIVATQGERSSGLVAQSIGGGGGTGGSASNTVLGPFSLTIGGSGGDGGSAGTPGTTQVSVLNQGIVSTAGNHAKGVVAQAVGGGGGDGGSAQSLSVSSQLNVSVAVGGNGGKGGTAGDVIATNNGEILTSGSDAWGLLAQSVAGGGGNGGSSISDAFQLPSAPDAPTLVVNYSVGGSGGDGSAAGNVYAYNNAVIMTAGATAHGLMAQSIGGGGGNGGDSSAFTVAVGNGTKADVSIAVGGKAGDGGTGGNVTVDNSSNSLIWTLGDSADGIFAQSVGGGGGSGGVSKNTDEFLGSSKPASGSLTVNLGGNGGVGTTGGNVTVTNEGNILTMGDSSNGIFAQSIGGGGGVATGGTSKSAVGDNTETVTTSGSGNGSGTGGAVSATNNATVVTYGGDAAGMLVQSVGGGGGKAGTGSTAGLPEANVSLSDYLASSSALKNVVANYAGVNAFGPAGWTLTSLQQMESWAQDYLAYAAAHPADTAPDGSGGTVSLQTFLGSSANGPNPGAYSNAGDGGIVSATNNFTLQTFGPASPGIVAQSIGGGGGENGATMVTQYQTDAKGLSSTASITSGSLANNSGNGGNVTVTNTGNIATGGDASFGILAQSVGAGGGQTTVTAANYASSSGVPITIMLGSEYGAYGEGGAVTVNNTQGSGSATINTSGNDAVGIVAQSIGAGGGDAVIMQSAASSGGYAAGVTNPLVDSSGSENAVTIGGNLSTAGKWTLTCPEHGHLFAVCGDGGAVTVNTSGNNTIGTSGRNAHGILAQSIGGGGGWIVGLTEASSPFNKPNLVGDGGNIALTLGGDIGTSGAGAYGVLAQSVGGGGVLGGDLALATTPASFAHDFFNGDDNTRWGNGGNIDIANSGTIVTSGANAHGIFAQSVGGGGGLYATTGGLLMGTTGGQGNAGSIEISNSGTITASGQGSSAIYVNSQGNNNTSLVTINNNGVITGNISAPAIMLTGGNKNGDGLVTNAGTIRVANGTAISAPDGFAVVNNDAAGVIYGNVNIGANNGMLTNDGYWGTNDNSTVENVYNYGTLKIYGANNNAMGNTNLNGFLTSSGLIEATVDFYNNHASVLNVTQGANLENGTTILVQPVTLTPNNAVTIMTSPGGSNFISIPNYIGVTDPGGNFIFGYGVTHTTSNSLGVVPLTSQFAAQQQAFAPSNANLSAIASNLDAAFYGHNVSASLASTYASFATINNGPAYINALNNLSSESTQAASVATLTASAAFVERMNSCPLFEEGAQFAREHDCVWSRVIGSDGDRDASGDSVGYHQSGQVFQLGGQKEVAPDWFVGGSASSDNTSINTNTVSDSVDGHGWTVGLVAKHQMGDWLVSAALDAGKMSYDSERDVQIPGLSGIAHASFDEVHFGLHSRISRQVVFKDWYLKPYIDLHMSHVESGGYTEQGAGALDLKAASSRANVFGASPMLEAGTKFEFTNGMTLQVYGGLGATFYNQSNLGTNMQFADSAPNAGWFHITSDVPQDRLKSTAGLDLKAGANLDIRLEYSGEFAKHFQSNAGAVKVSYRF